MEQPMISSPAAVTYGLTPMAEAAKMPGLAFLQGMIDGLFPAPPIARSCHFTLVSVAKGEAVFEGEPTEDFFNPLGSIHGGWIATLLDSAMACAIHTTLRPGEAYTTSQMNLNYVRAIMPATGRVRCEGKVISRGGRIATSEGRLLDQRGRVLAHGTETCFIFPLEPVMAAKAE
jgi:uncharacterized protein (TIGR00369 family)